MSIVKTLLQIRSACMVTRPVLDELQFGKAMAQLREDAGITVPALAKEIGANEERVWAFESGFSRLPPSKQIAYLDLCQKATAPTNHHTI